MTGFDVHEHRHELKLRRESADTALYENRGGAECPACGGAFGTVFVSEKRATTFDPDAAVPFCVLREGDRILVFTHDG